MQKRLLVRPICFAFIAILCCSMASGQNRDNQDTSPLPDDERLLSLHRNFVRDAVALAEEYERDDEVDRARAVYQEILKLVPEHAPSKRKLEELLQREAYADSMDFTVRADPSWQSTGVVVEEGKPLTVVADGTWTLDIRAEVTANGIPYPEEFLELRNFKDFRMGCLVGLIENGNPEDRIPFFVGSGREFIAPHTGVLMLKIWDLREFYNVRDSNEGVLEVTIRGTFEQTDRN